MIVNKENVKNENLNDNQVVIKLEEAKSIRAANIKTLN